MALHHILISVGSNIERSKHVRLARLALELHFESVKCSSVYESEAVGFHGEAFYNLVVEAQTSLSVEKVCEILKQIEAQNGRRKSDKKFSSRTLDLDLLTYDCAVIEQPVVLPREEILTNAFVLWPLAELVPNNIHPIVKQTYRDLWHSFDQTAQNLWPIKFAWNEG
ncbi:2-amino-4-hydroxy-6-hydroxymethyldihydropteridine diphosphokinase [Alteromonas aestuariivivens]|uniref:2-amino-4-hydroxy-6-hydroxymethyldihydropteridine diphosphokinase n=1 Tax=Alteromonas aestuariivivens TaxID=1938339 RepID=A0A3D8MD04_9ALTE|nr:2-amino-4-hydroxy-6-hydroxymethyldihydropteridine diphosphokinase [Alteromonas aestuariivivens]RDV28053.1 2-amino-4-hydroxy-6-hydroxymethyldihydropteridine diphosphokinase [Alteromonas aestuariivivens]